MADTLAQRSAPTTDGNTLTVLNWQSRRATEPMAAAIESFSQTHPGAVIRQKIRPLSDFEHQSMEEVAQHHDLIVYDHPFSGAIAQSGCLAPLDEHLPDLLGNGADERYVGPGLASYRYAGHVWGAPIDGATQHAIYRADLLDALGADTPRSHADVVALGERARRRGWYLGTGIATPHAFMSVLSYMANLGEPMQVDDRGAVHFPEQAFDHAYGALREITALSAPDSLEWNSIDVHEAMVARDDVVYCPAVYGYATYGESDQRRRLSFADFAGLRPPYAAGATIGGTALGLSSHCKARELALAFIRHMLSDDVQSRLIGAHYGQPATVIGWDKPENDVRFNGFYSGARESMTRSWVRPRHPGYVEFQRRCGLIVAEGVRRRQSAATVRDALLDLATALNPADAPANRG